jgi:predicted DNA-binding transcriptional regulator AlpA
VQREKQGLSFMLQSSTTIAERDAAAYIAFTSAALRAWRRQGRGPAFIRIGRSVRYRVRDLDAWLDAHVVQTRESGATPCA